MTLNILMCKIEIKKQLKNDYLIKNKNRSIIFLKK